jgi:membrane protein involved in colicin uptake
MKREFWTRQLPIALLVSALIVTSAVAQNKTGKIKQTATDTLPDRNKKVRDIDDALDELEKSKAEVDRSLKNIDWDKIETDIKTSIKNIDINKEKMKADIDKAMKEVDKVKIQAQVDKAMKEVDMAKVQAELDKNMKEVDMAKIQAQVDKAMKDADMAKIKAEVDASVANVDWDKIKAEIDRVKDVDMEQIESNLKKMKPEIEKSINKAHASIEKAKKEMTEYKNFIDGLDKDGLINKKENYTIEYKSGELTINGKKQPADVVNKYSSFLKGRKDFTIKKDADNFNIDND